LIIVVNDKHPFFRVRKTIRSWSGVTYQSCVLPQRDEKGEGGTFANA
jgi:hypothetical protein